MYVTTSDRRQLLACELVTTERKRGAGNRCQVVHPCPFHLSGYRPAACSRMSRARSRRGLVLARVSRRILGREEHSRRSVSHVLLYHWVLRCCIRSNRRYRLLDRIQQGILGDIGAILIARHVRHLDLLSIQFLCNCEKYIYFFQFRKCE